MSLANIRTEGARYINLVNPGLLRAGYGDFDAAVNAWYLTCWRKLDQVAPHRTRTTQTLALIASQLTAYTLTTAPLALIYMQPPHANRNERKFTFAVADDAFYKHEDQTDIWVAQEGETSLITRPAIDAAMTATVHYIKKPSTITTSVTQEHFDDQTLAAGAIGLLFHSIGLADALLWIDERNPKQPAGIAYTRLRNELHTLAKFGINSNLTSSVEGWPP